jgi:hypothetical protein
MLRPKYKLQKPQNTKITRKKPIKKGISLAWKWVIIFLFAIAITIILRVNLNINLTNASSNLE